MRYPTPAVRTLREDWRASRVGRSIPEAISRGAAIAGGRPNPHRSTLAPVQCRCTASLCPLYCNRDAGLATSSLKDTCLVYGNVMKTYTPIRAQGPDRQVCRPEGGSTCRTIGAPTALRVWVFPFLHQLIPPPPPPNPRTYANPERYVTNHTF